MKMKAIYLDCFAGISGNMLLGAFLQAGVPQAYLREQLSRLPVADEFILHIDEVKKNGIAALYVDVELTGRMHRMMDMNMNMDMNMRIHMDTNRSIIMPMCIVR